VSILYISKKLCKIFKYLACKKSDSYGRGERYDQNKTKYDKNINMIRIK